ncbi:MAG: S-layer homology domain-containing protein, partial [Eubacteriales bacterium]|nr:S-layer homology domain-containing protein [Eubacteriales bacterium]
MRSINKILSVCLITVTLFGICTFAYADNERADIDYTISAKADFLKRLGIIDNDFDDSTFESDMTRGEFATFVACANKFASAKGDNVRYFVDIDSNSKCFESVSDLIENNIISSADDGRFRPNDTITYYEACVMLVNSLGYKSYALANGGYPSGYLKAARTAKLNGYNSDSGVSVSDGISLLYDALSAESYNIDSIGADGNTYSRNGDTWLYNSFRLKSAKGSVESVYGATLYSDKVSDEGYMLISGKQYSVSDGFDNSNLIGGYVDFFYNEDKNEVFFALENTAAKESEKIDISLLNNFSDNRISFYANENSSKILSYALDADAISVYNGMPLTSDVENIISNLKNTKGYITLKDSDASGGYDTVIIESYR